MPMKNAPSGLSWIGTDGCPTLPRSGARFSTSPCSSRRAMISEMVCVLRLVKRARSAFGMLPCRRIACSTTRSLNWLMPIWLEPRGRSHGWLCSSALMWCDAGGAARASIQRRRPYCAGVDRLISSSCLHSMAIQRRAPRWMPRGARKAQQRSTAATVCRPCHAGNYSGVTSPPRFQLQAGGRAAGAVAVDGAGVVGGVHQRRRGGVPLAVGDVQAQLGTRPVRFAHGDRRGDGQLGQVGGVAGGVLLEGGVAQLALQLEVLRERVDRTDAGRGPGVAQRDVVGLVLLVQRDELGAELLGRLHDDVVEQTGQLDVAAVLRAGRTADARVALAAHADVGAGADSVLEAEGVAAAHDFLLVQQRRRPAVVALVGAAGGGLVAALAGDDGEVGVDGAARIDRQAFVDEVLADRRLGVGDDRAGRVGAVGGVVVLEGVRELARTHAILS